MTQRIDYRRIYENEHGPIPRELDGRTYEIHHIDGNRNNNMLTNLKCVTLLEHYKIHQSQGDWAACARMSVALKLTPKEISENNRKNAIKRIENGTHNFLGGKAVKQKVKNGTHHLLKRKDGTSIASDLVAAGKHHFLMRINGTSMSSDRVSNGTHNFLNKIGDKHPRHDSKKYIFINNKTNKIISMTQCEFKRTISPNNVVALIKGRVKSVKGYELLRLTN